MESDVTEDVWVEPEAPPPESEAPSPEPEGNVGASDIPSGEQGAGQTAEPPSDVDPDPPAPAGPEAASEHDAPEQPAEPLLAPADFELEPARVQRSGGWLAGALVLVLVLAGQMINHYRGTLATMPSIGPKVRAAYGVLGIPIVPLWNVRDYEARQLGATVSGSSPREIRVRASIANRGRWPLPLPLLRVSLQDRYGRTIAARDVPPREYLPGPSAGSSMLPAGRRIDATVAFVNPGPQAVGFEIDACLREGTAVVCAHGPH